MENINTASIGDMIVESIDTIAPEETVTVAKRRMESQTSRSLIVVDADRPVGIIQWRGLTRHEGSELIRDVMQLEFPILRSSMSVDDVRAYLGSIDVDLDHLPVVDDSGILLGEVPRGVLMNGETTTSVATEAVLSPPERGMTEDGLSPFRLEQGMKIIGANGKNIGSIDEIELTSDGQIAHFTVKYGLLGRNSKRLPADVISQVEGDEVHVRLDQTEFKMLADVGEDVI